MTGFCTPRHCRTEAACILFRPLSRGAENIIDSGGSFDPNRILHFVADEGVTVLPFLAPTMIVRLLDADPDIHASTLRAIIYGGAPIHLKHLHAALRRFGPTLTQVYGQGEAPMTISYLPSWAHEDAGDEALRSAGFVRSGVEVRILDSEGGTKPTGEAGEIVVRGGRRDARLLAKRERQCCILPRRLADDGRHRPL
jgi:acyl-CoA synthetase (AMP-forming)/AMP-acid ligase II